MRLYWRETMKIKNKTKQGYIDAEVGDGIDISTRMKDHRGTVQKGLSQTITCAGGNNIGVMVNESRERESRVVIMTFANLPQKNVLC